MNDFLKKYASLLLLICLLASMTVIPVSAAEASGSCGDNVSWALSGYALTIDGTGPMTDFSEASMAPWYDLRADIRSITITSGVTSVGDLAFYDLGELTRVSLPDSIGSIGFFSFAKCKKLTGISSVAGVTSIGESAFEECESLVSFRFPDTLTTISTRSFYRCYSLLTVTVPSSVTEMGSSIFAYCEGLLCATINANIQTMPVWTFYGCSSLTKVILPVTVTSIGEYNFTGCDNLTAVCYNGDYETGAKILADIRATEQDFSDSTIILAPDYTSPLTSSSTTESGGQSSSSVTSYTQSDNSAIATTVTTTTPVITPSSESIPTGKSETSVSAVVNNDDGWDEVAESIKSIDEKRGEDETSPITADITLTDTTIITEDVIKKLAQSNVNVSITASDGSIVAIVPNDIDTSSLSSSYDISYTVEQGKELTEEQKKVVGDTTTFGLSFKDNIGFKFSPKVYLGTAFANQSATLYQNNPDKGLEKLQSVIVDNNGYASFYLASTKKSTEYTVAMNVQGENENAVIPTNASRNEYGDIENMAQTEYVVTGVKTMLGLSVMQFTWIVVGVLGFLVIIVGVVMFMLNRSKLKFAAHGKNHN